MRRTVRIAIVVVLGLALLVGAGLVAAYRAAQHVPNFYRIALTENTKDPKKAADRMIQQVTGLQNRAVRPGAWHAAFTSEEINGWLAVELPRNHPDLLPPDARDPRVVIHADRVAMGFRVDRGGLSSVVSLELEVYMDSPGVVAVRVRKVRVGAIPWSPKRLLDGIADAARKSDVRVQWRQAGGDPVALITLPPIQGEHGKLIRIGEIQLEEDVVHVSGTTEARAKK